MKKLNVWLERTKARTWANNCLSRNGSNAGLFEKVKEKLFEKDVDRGLELAGAYRKTDKGIYKARTSKLNLKRV